MYLVLLVPIAIFLLWWYAKWISMKNYWKNLGVPQSDVHPILGSLTFLQKKNPGVWLTELYREFKGAPYVGIWVFWRRGLVINDPNLARQVLVKDADIFKNRLLASGKTDPMGALNLFTVDDPLWSSVRRRLTMLFTGSKLRGWQELYQSKVADLVYRINSDNEKGITINLRSLFADFTTDVIGESSFGIQCQATRNSSGPLRAMTKDFEQYNTWRGMSWSSIFFLPDIVDIFRFSLWPKHTVVYFRKIFKMMVEERGGYEGQVEGKRDLLDALLKMKQDAVKENQDLDEDVLISNAMIFLQGGYDTSSAVLTYTIYELAHYPEKQQILYEELAAAKKALGDKKFDAESLAQLPYLDACLKESLRKYPIMGWMDRLALKSYKVDEKLTIPANTVVYVNVSGMQMDPDYFPDPQEFRPERFLPENAANIVPYTYLPFGEGPRMCIGKRIGQNTMRYALSAVILNFEVKPLPKFPTPNEITFEKKGLFYIPGIPLSVEFKPRK
ncbi:cytochrome P450 6k1-like [Helicoverpa zea]|uniref:cytochrome P450 6k1-like n=1 Tax=Helicoverpa zea TaxID=7113 RepID=UPI001F5AE13C|nr:cytochrome P450 6k1-like [Helicoverpa zea]